MTASVHKRDYENLYSPQMVELRNNKNNNNLKKLHEKSTSDNYYNSLDLTKCTTKFTVQ